MAWRSLQQALDKAEAPAVAEQRRAVATGEAALREREESLEQLLQAERAALQQEVDTRVAEAFRGKG